MISISDVEKLFHVPRSVPYAAIAGVFGFLGSLFGRFSSSTEHINYICAGMNDVRKNLFGDSYEMSDFCEMSSVLTFIKLTFMHNMVVFNMGVWVFYLKALRASDSSLPATLISTAINFTLSALLGAFIFGEAVTFLWCCGLISIITGLIFVGDRFELDVPSKDE
ncbi:hypothetical protein J437_LFUL018748 [Ladona fulva]|uniref:Transmembrane protein 42 n=1 Tax=Ladona fulva TaxID=123851 RepID=A0A8K0PED8_LADFU|nr:hypothetical protein J437_LFUL018748 [Ladona fulva]